ncbi:MAG: class II aldolase/adducin family protein [Actinobacteria bacterium]|nr:class II aldolase/adducin family protein [Actinomycetota bacterium]
MEKTENQHKSDIIEVCRRVYAKGWVAANDGNVSIKVSPNTIICTPTGMSKGYITAEQLIKVDMTGNRIEGELEPSSEVKMHIDVYKNKPGVNAVVHAHPPFATGYAVAGIPLEECVIPEIIVSLGSIPLAKYGTPSTMEIPENIRPYLKEYNVFLLQNHGALSIGEDVFRAYYRMESLELFAKINFIARLLGNVNVLGEEEVKRIISIRENFGLSNLNYPGCRIDSKFVKSADSNGKDRAAPSSNNPVVQESFKEDLAKERVFISDNQKHIELSKEKLVELITAIVSNIINKVKS